MKYIFDTTCFRIMSNYYPDRFPSFWDSINNYISQSKILSTREVYNEYKNQMDKPHMIDWIKTNKGIFIIPTSEETRFIAQIFNVNHFQNVIDQQNIRVGRPSADPFVIAAAKVKKGCVVTEEKFKPHAAKIPNICDHFKVECVNLEEFMKREGWTF